MCDWTKNEKMPLKFDDSINTPIIWRCISAGERLLGSCQTGRLRLYWKLWNNNSPKHRYWHMDNSVWCGNGVLPRRHWRHVCHGCPTQQTYHCGGSGHTVTECSLCRMQWENTAIIHHNSIHLGGHSDGSIHMFVGFIPQLTIEQTHSLRLLWDRSCSLTCNSLLITPNSAHHRQYYPQLLEFEQVVNGEMSIICKEFRRAGMW